MVVPAIAPDGFSGSGDAARSERAIRWLHPGRAKDKCRSSTPLGRALVAIGADQARGLRLQQRGYVRLMMDDVSLDRASNELCDWEGAPARRAHNLLSSHSSFASRHHGRREPERRPRRIRGARIRRSRTAPSGIACSGQATGRRCSCSTNFPGSRPPPFVSAGGWQPAGSESTCRSSSASRGRTIGAAAIARCCTEHRDGM